MKESEASLTMDGIRKTKDLLDAEHTWLEVNIEAETKKEKERLRVGWQSYMQGRRFRNGLEYKAVRQAFESAWYLSLGCSR